MWGARTLRGNDTRSDEFRYVNVRRLALFIEQSVYNGRQWAVFEPNAEPLWASRRQSIGDFMTALFRQGAFYDYHVTCDATTTTAADIADGIVNVLIGFAPLRPSQWNALFSVLGTMYGGDGRTTFALPKLAPLTDENGGELRYIICLQGIYPQRN